MTTQARPTRPEDPLRIVPLHVDPALCTRSSNSAPSVRSRSTLGTVGEVPSRRLRTRGTVLDGVAVAHAAPARPGGRRPGATRWAIGQLRHVHASATTDTATATPSSFWQPW